MLSPSAFDDRIEHRCEYIETAAAVPVLSVQELFGFLKRSLQFGQRPVAQPNLLPRRPQTRHLFGDAWLCAGVNRGGKFSGRQTQGRVGSPHGCLPAIRRLGIEGRADARRDQSVDRLLMSSNLALLCLPDDACP
jgi:hypothetical protein